MPQQRARQEPLPWRPTDRFEATAAWILVLVAAFVVLESVVIGLRVHEQVLTGNGAMRVITVAPVTARPTRGEILTTWSKHAGEPLAAQNRAAGPTAAGAVAAATVLGIGLTVLLAIWAGIREITAACNAAGWEREWVRVEPAWSGRSDSST